MSFPVHWFLKPVFRHSPVSNMSGNMSHPATLEAKPLTTGIISRIISGPHLTEIFPSKHSRCFHNSTYIAVLLAFGFQPNCAWAQYSPDASMDLGISFGQMALGQAAISGTRRIGIQSERAFHNEEKSTPDDTVSVTGSLTFKSLPSVTKVVNDRFAAWQSKNNPEMLAEIEAEIASGTLQHYFGEILNKYQIESDNLADVSAAYYITLWKIIHGRDLTLRQVSGVRDQMRSFMAEDAELMQLPDADKQEISETFILHSAVALQGYDQLVEANDTQTLALYRDWLQTNLAPQGPDMIALEISDEGFVSAR